MYGIPFDIGMVGFWYNKDLFTQAGITAPPATWAELLDAVRKLKAAGITPVALAGKDKWPAHFYWAYLAMRIGGLGALQKAADDKNFDDPGLRRRRRAAQGTGRPRSRSRRASSAPSTARPTGRPRTMGNGGAAMELMGQWAPVGAGVQLDRARRASATSSASSRSRRVDGGKGAPTEVFGGGDGFAVGKDAPAGGRRLPEVPAQRRQPAPVRAKTGAVLPTVKDAADARSPTPTTRSSRRRWPTPPASSSTSTRRTRPPSASRSTTASPS